MQQVTKNILIKNKKHLDTISDQLVEELTKIVKGDWGLSATSPIKKVKLLDIEVFIDGYRLALYPMDKKATQLGYKSLLNDEYPYGLLNDGDLSPDFDDYDSQDEDEKKDMDAFDQTQKDIFINWFVSCWNKVDSTPLTLPIYLCFHNSFNSFDLKKNTWTKEK